MKKLLALTLLVLVICISGCVSTTKTSLPVSPEDLAVSIEPLVIKEFNEQDISVAVSNNNSTQAIDLVSVSSFDPFTLVGPGSQVNIPAKGKAALSFRIMAPSFDKNTSMLTLSYSSGIDGEEKPIVNTKVVPVQIVVLPDAKLQFVGFAESMDNLRSSPPVSTWEAKKGENVTVKFSVKNHGQSTIAGDSMYVVVDIENKLIGNSSTVNITEAMAKGGTSYTRGIELPILKDAPNGETNVYVNLMKGDYLLDTQTIVLKVKL
ncbi:hypothetical protein RSJ42_01010 [Methanosarcina hadiensis]|uniref:hypothetical protein n=1 Tax=Methanosarcina hadiensis TaxID=3078083 RepID=UPI003977529C